MDQETLTALQDEHPGSSWALWSERFPDDGYPEDSPNAFVEFVRSHVEELRPEVVLLSLNRRATRPRTSATSTRRQPDTSTTSYGTSSKRAASAAPT